MSLTTRMTAVGVAAALAFGSLAVVSPASADGKWRSNRDAAIAAGAVGFAAGAIVGAAAQPNYYYGPGYGPGYYAPPPTYVAPRGVYYAPAPRVYYRPPAYRADCGVKKVKAWNPVQRRNVTVNKKVVCR